MKRRIMMMCALLAIASIGLSAQNTQLQAKQKEFLSWKFGMFLHYNMGTYCNREWATGYEDPLIFNPRHLDCNQWAREAKRAGMKYLVLTTKHTGGWCLWDSKYTTHDITAFKNYKDGKGDIVREFVNACRKYKMKVGLYYCLPNLYYSKIYGNLEDEKRGWKITKDQEVMNGLPLEAKGDYEGFMEKQITELLTNYGKIDYFFFDQYHNSITPNECWTKLKALIFRLQPNCVVIGNNSHDFNDTDICEFEFPWLTQSHQQSTPLQGNKLPSEVCDCISGAGIWFWNSERDMKLRKPEDIIKALRMCNSNNSNYLLDVPPSRDGRIDGEKIGRAHV